jgi:uncharacterized damage-inducible protein DinB
MTIQLQKRRAGAVGAMMDEYERAVAELSELVSGLSDPDFDALRDTQTQDEDCRSIRTIMRHVIRAGYGYATDIRNAFGVPAERPKVELPSRSGCEKRLREVMAYNEATLEGHWLLTYEEITAVKIDAPWGVRYDLEQYLEHAIVHVLRHRRQIERFLSEPQFRPKGA